MQYIYIFYTMPLYSLLCPILASWQFNSSISLLRLQKQNLYDFPPSRGFLNSECNCLYTFAQKIKATYWWMATIYPSFYAALIQFRETPELWVASFTKLVTNISLVFSLTRPNYKYWSTSTTETWKSVPEWMCANECVQGYSHKVNVPLNSRWVLMRNVVLWW